MMWIGLMKRYGWFNGSTSLMEVIIQTNIIKAIWNDYDNNSFIVQTSQSWSIKKKRKGLIKCPVVVKKK